MKYCIKNFIAILFVHFLFIAPSYGEAVDSPENWIIEKIECSGNEITACSIIENEIYLRAGDKVNEEQIENAQLRLKTLGLFYDVQMSLQKGVIRGQVILVVQVQERSAHYMNLSGYSYKSNTASGIIGIGDRNLFGLGKRLEVDVERSFDQNRQSFNAMFEDPNIFGSSKYFSSVHLLYFKVDNDDIQYKSSILSIALGRRIFDFSYIKLIARGGLSEFSTSGVSNGEYKSLGEGVEYGWNTLDDLYFPTSGTTLAAGSYFSDIGARYYLSSSFINSLYKDYYLTLEGGLDLDKFDSDSAFNGTLSFRPAIAKYFTFHRQGQRIPDKMKIFLGADAFNLPATSSRIEFNGTLGVSYLIDSFGKIDFTVSFQDMR
ncbi:MAG TPA: POTRA domain-containing protein [Pseudobdellovibrionaceae bacterium]|jgi:hypothetical protein